MKKGLGLLKRLSSSSEPPTISEDGEEGDGRATSLARRFKSARSEALGQQRASPLALAAPAPAPEEARTGSSSLTLAVVPGAGVSGAVAAASGSTERAASGTVVFTTGLSSGAPFGRASGRRAAEDAPDCADAPGDKRQRLGTPPPPDHYPEPMMHDHAPPERAAGSGHDQVQIQIPPQLLPAGGGADVAGGGIVLGTLGVGAPLSGGGPSAPSAPTGSQAEDDMIDSPHRPGGWSASAYSAFASAAAQAVEAVADAGEGPAAAAVFAPTDGPAAAASVVGSGSGLMQPPEQGSFRVPAPVMPRLNTFSPPSFGKLELWDSMDVGAASGSGSVVGDEWLVGLGIAGEAALAGGGRQGSGASGVCGAVQPRLTSFYMPRVSEGAAASIRRGLSSVLAPGSAAMLAPPPPPSEGPGPN